MENINLANIRKSLKKTQQQFADCLGVNQATISRWEKEAPIRGPALKMIKILLNDKKENVA